MMDMVEFAESLGIKLRDWQKKYLEIAYKIYKRKKEKTNMKRFDINNYKGNYVMHCKTEEELATFYDYLDRAGKRWYSGSSYKVYRPGTDCIGARVRYVFFNDGTYGFYCDDGRYTILTFSDFDWSNHFTKSDLKDGMVVEYSNGDRKLVLNGMLMDAKSWVRLSDFNENLDRIQPDWDDTIHPDINKVYTTRGWLLTNLLDDGLLNLVWERKEEPDHKEMTIAEIEEKLGYKIKVIADKE